MADQIMASKLKFCKVRKVKSPTRAHDTDAGIDFYVPEDLTPEVLQAKCEMTKNFVFYKEENGIVSEITLCPHESILLPSGIHVKIPHGYALVYMNKSGVASKKHLHVGACVVDESYEGECHLNLTNVGDCNITIHAGEKLVQGIVLQVNYCMTEEFNSLDELYADSNSARGDGGFGSTGIK